MNKTGAISVTTRGDREIVVTRAFDAPGARAWEAMTTPALIRRWLFLPEGWTMTKCEEDIRVGGSFLWEWAGPDGARAMTLSGVYREVVPGARLSRSEVFDIVGPGRMPEQISTVEFVEQGGKTIVRVTILFPSKEARDGMLASGMEQGMGAGYDRLAAMLAE